MTPAPPTTTSAEVAQHTAGPWSACRNGDCACGMVTSEHHPVATITSGEWGDDWPSLRVVGTSTLDLRAEAFMDRCVYGTVSPAVAAANARLIAAAPDLLAALRDLSARLDGSHEMWPELHAARAAITKATAS